MFIYFIGLADLSILTVPAKRMFHYFINIFLYYSNNVV